MTRELTVPFHAEGIRLIIADDGAEYVPLKPICERLELNWEATRRRLSQQDARWHTRTIDAPTYRTVGGNIGPEREMTCIPRVRLGGWLYSINPAKVKPESREALIRYQQELDLVIDAFLTGNHTQETETLRRQNKALRALCLAFNPVWGKIAALQQAGLASWAIRYHLKRSREDTRAAIAQMQDVGIIALADWDDEKPEEDAPLQQGELPLEEVQHG